MIQARELSCLHVRLEEMGEQQGESCSWNSVPQPSGQGTLPWPPVTLTGGSAISRPDPPWWGGG